MMRGTWEYPTDRVCPCGRGLPLLDRITGRTAEQIVLPDGKYLPGLILTDIFEHSTYRTAVLDYQIVQETVDKIVINIVRSDQYSPAISDEIQKYLLGDSWVRISRSSSIFHDEIPTHGC